MLRCIRAVKRKHLQLMGCKGVTDAYPVAVSASSPAGQLARVPHHNLVLVDADLDRNATTVILVYDAYPLSGLANSHALP